MLVNFIRRLKSFDITFSLRPVVPNWYDVQEGGARMLPMAAVLVRTNIFLKEFKVNKEKMDGNKVITDAPEHKMPADFDSSENSSRDKILAAVKQNQPAFISLPAIENFIPSFSDVVDKFKTTILTVGGFVQEVKTIGDIITILKGEYTSGQRMVSVLNEFEGFAEIFVSGDDPHKLNDVEVAIIKAEFGVAENGAVWVTEKMLQERVLPFICQHLVAVIDVKNIVATMHDAYDVIGDAPYGFGTFIAGPSKTADIEQSLVLGAHGPKTMTIFILV